MFSFFSNFETYKAEFEIYLEDKLIQRQSAEAPKEMLMATFMQTVQQIAQDKRAMQFKMIVPNTIWDNFESKQKVLNNEILFKNNAMVAFEESMNKEVKNNEEN